MSVEQSDKVNSVEWGAQVCRNNPRLLSSRRGRFDSNVSADTKPVALSDVYQEIDAWRVNTPDFRDAGIVHIETILNYTFAAPSFFILSAKLAVANLIDPFDTNDATRGLPDTFVDVAGAEITFNRRDAAGCLAGEAKLVWKITQGLRTGSTWRQTWEAMLLATDVGTYAATASIEPRLGACNIDPTVHKVWQLSLKLAAPLTLPDAVYFNANDAMLFNPRNNGLT